MPAPNEAKEGAKKQILHQKICQSLNSLHCSPPVERTCVICLCVQWKLWFVIV